MSKKPQILIRIVLPEDGCGRSGENTRFRHNGEMLEGILEVETETRRDLEFTVRFEGVSRTWIRQNSQGLENGKILTGEHLVLSQSQHIPRCNAQLDRNGSMLCYSAPFQFNIPQQLIFPLHSEQFLDLPPSLESGRPFQDHFNGKFYKQPAVGYSIRAEVVAKSSTGRGIEDEKRVATRQIVIMPLRKATPPVEVEDLPGEYRFATAKAPKQHLWSKILGQLEASAPEPPPLNMATKTPSSSSLVSLRLKCRLQEEAAIWVLPLDWELVTETRIIAFTFYSCQPLEQAPSLQDSKTKPFVNLHSDFVFKEKRSFSNVPWRPSRLLSFEAALTSQSTIWDANLDIPISAPKRLAPTFLTPLAARRYALRIIIRIAGLHHQALELQLPLQKVHEPFDVAQGRSPHCCQSLSDFLGMTSPAYPSDTGLSDQDNVIEPIGPPPYYR